MVPFEMFSKEVTQIRADKYSIIKESAVDLKTSVFDDVHITEWDFTTNLSPLNKELEILSRGYMEDKNTTSSDIIILFNLYNSKNVGLYTGYRRIFEDGGENQIAAKLSYLSFPISNEIFFFSSTSGDLSFRPLISQESILTEDIMFSVDIESNIYLQDMENQEIESGVADLSIEPRLIYGVGESMSLFVAAVYTTLVGGTRSNAENNGDDTSSTVFSIGLTLNIN